MQPMFSKRSLLAIFIGLVVGLACGFGYSAFNYSNAEFNAGWPPITVSENTSSRVYETTIQGRMMPAIADETFIRTMDQQEQFYAARMGSLPFFRYFSEFLASQAPEYAHTPEELSQKIRISYVTLADNPSTLQVKAGFPSSQETLFIIRNLPPLFEKYIQAEQNNLQAQAFAKKAKQVDEIRTAYQQSINDLIDATVKADPPDFISPITSSQEYIDLAAKIASLQDEIKKQAQVAAELLAQGLTPADSTYPSGIVPVAADERNPAAIDAKIKGLEEALQQKAWVAAGFTLSQGSSSEALPNIALLSQEYQIAAAYQYANALKGMELISTELSQAQARMDILQANVSRSKLDAAVANEPNSIAFEIASDRAKRLSEQLSSLTRELQDMDPAVPASQIVSFYTVEAPLVPVAPGLGKSAPLLGALLGMFGGWFFINRRWLAGSHHDVPSELEDNEEPENEMDDMVEHQMNERDAAALREMENWSVHSQFEESGEPDKPVNPSEVEFKNSEDFWLNGHSNITPEGTDFKEDEEK